MEEITRFGRIEQMKAPETVPPMQQRLCELLPRMRRFARSLTGHPQDADDLVQIAVERALLRSSQWREEQGGLEPWLFGIVRNAWLDEARARQRRGRMFAPEEQGEHVGHAHVDAHAVVLSVEAAMMKLPEEQRVAVALVLVEGLSYREAAAALDVPVGTLTSRLARGRDALQRMLGDTRE
ncbi:sigma-70 family RNA polymerase sigma factor [Novilysobacter erysipheiresistens]|uniref:Sigma-70 family RNA polymerase sigma factor n=1 Tax=Novilysobacter erysipheiresistens TaxID=1749332 RepID=A0ABU7YWZ0_9GAMM